MKGKVVVVVVEGAPVGEQGGEKGEDPNVGQGGCADHGLPCGSTQQPLEAPAGLRMWLVLWLPGRTKGYVSTCKNQDQHREYQHIETKLR